MKSRTWPRRSLGWGAKEGWRWLNLGMAPLAGIRRGPLPSLWNDVGSLVFAASFSARQEQKAKTKKAQRKKTKDQP